MGAPAAVSVVAVVLPATAGVEWAPSSGLDDLMEDIDGYVLLCGWVMWLC